VSPHHARGEANSAGCGLERSSGMVGDASGFATAPSTYYLVPHFSAGACAFGRCDNVARVLPTRSRKPRDKGKVEARICSTNAWLDRAIGASPV
jgi:hypothetical protein